MPRVYLLFLRIRLLLNSLTFCGSWPWLPSFLISADIQFLDIALLFLTKTCFSRRLYLIFWALKLEILGIFIEDFWCLCLNWGNLGVFPSLNAGSNIFDSLCSILVVFVLKKDRFLEYTFADWEAYRLSWGVIPWLTIIWDCYGVTWEC